MRAAGLACALTIGAAGLHAYAAGPASPAAATVRVETDLSTRTVRTEESNLANVATDAIRAVEKTDAAVMHASAFAEVSVAKGDAPVTDILKAVQYQEDTVVIVSLTGAQLRKALENGLRLYPQKSPEFLQVSGLTVTVDPSQEKEKRVVAVRVGRAALDESRKYTVAMPSPLANGALGYYKVWDKTTAIDHETSKTVGQAVTEYLAANKTLAGKGDERIVIKK